MAEIQESGGSKHDGGKVRSKKASTKVDMTPMVDLGFLLITFFMFTTTFSKPNNMKLSMPQKNKDKEKQETADIKMSNTISILIGKDDRVFWHQQAAKTITPELLNESNYSREGIRKQIIDAKKNAIDSSKFTVIIKATDDATYKNAVDILDEMAITKSTRYGLVDVSKEEQATYESKIASAPTVTPPTPNTK